MRMRMHAANVCIASLVLGGQGGATVRLYHASANRCRAPSLTTFISLYNLFYATVCIVHYKKLQTKQLHAPRISFI